MASSGKKVGSVALVGAGSGDPGLLTVRGAELLRRAEVVVYDYLANPQLLALCPTARHLYVGKSASKHSMTQDQINALLVELGLEGKRVVRLKGGDPFVFGRGGEECLALKEAGIPFVVVPGITAAIAAPAYAGIPVTHRDFNSSFTLVTGHEKEEDYKDPDALKRGNAKGSSDIDWATLAKLPSMAFYMGVKALPRICKSLIDHGMNPNTPAATVQWGTTPRQKCVTGTITTLPDIVKAAKISAPAITIVGKTVELRESMNWFESRPLFGQTIIVTRTRQQASELSEKLADLGANVIEAPTIDIAQPKSWKKVDAALASLKSADKPDWILFTSANGVYLSRQRMKALGIDARSLSGVRVGVVGEATADAVRESLCIEPDCVPPQFVAEALAEELAKRGDIKGKKYLLLRADIARPVLVEKLQAGGAARVDDVSVYETKIVDELPQALHDALAAGTVQWATFTSSSTARNFVQLLGDQYGKKLNNVKIVSIGPVTTQTLNDLKLPPTVQATQADIDSVVNAIIEQAGK